MWLRMRGVPRILPIEKKRRKLDQKPSPATFSSSSSSLLRLLRGLAWSPLLARLRPIDPPRRRLVFGADCHFAVHVSLLVASYLPWSFLHRMNGECLCCLGQ